MIDVDSLRCGSPLEDVANLIATMYYRTGLNNGSPGEVDEAAAKFSRAYSASVPWRVPERDLAWHTAYALVSERACCSIKRRACQNVALLLATAERLLSENRV
jgi:hypothetical protein